jgi:hypothetical protein
VIDTRPGTHCLNFARTDHVRVPEAVFVLEPAAQRNRNDLHLTMRMHAETRPRNDRIVVEDPQRTEIEARRIVIVGETERMVGPEPAVVEIAARGGLVQKHVHETIR